MTQLFANNAASELASAVTSGAVSLTLKTGDGAKFPSPVGGDFFLVTLYQKVGQDEINHEIVKCTARAGDVLTVVRAQEGTTARAFSVDDPLELRLTAGALTAMQDGIAAGAQVNTVTSVAAKTGAVTLVKSDVGLGNVDNTTDAAKPISTATRTALDGKASLASPHFIGTVIANSSPASVGISALLGGSNSGYESKAQGDGIDAGAATFAFHRPGNYAVHFGLDTDNKLKVGGWTMGANAYAIYHENNKPTKADVGLGNVDNTTDAAKPVSTATQTALNAKVGATGGTASGLTLNDGYTEEVFAVTGTTPALSPTSGSIQTWTLTGNSTPTAGTWASGQSMTLMVDDGSAYTINWASMSITWKTGGGTAPTLLTTGYTVIELTKVGTTIYGWLAGDA